MKTAEIATVGEVMSKIQQLSPAARVSLAKKILDTLDPSSFTSVSRRSGPSAAEVAAMFHTERPAPDDATVQRWMDEYRMEKYGS